MKILIATDGSSYSRAAVEECCQWIIKPDMAEILIVSAFDDAYAITAEPFALSAEYYQKLEDGLTEFANGCLRDAENMIRAKFASTSLKVSTVVLHGSPDQEIIEKATEWKADLIVVGSHGRGFWGRLLGSVSNGVVHHAPCSVLVVRGPVTPGKEDSYPELLRES